MTDPNAHTDYSFADIERYLNGDMTVKEMHDLERAALQDPFLADAVEGYQGADKNTARRHLNEIMSALQKEEPAKVIPLPKKKNYGWLVAASLLAVIGTGIFLLTDQNKSSAPLAANELNNIPQTDSASENNKPLLPKADSAPVTVSDNLALSKKENKDYIATTVPSSKKKALPYKETPDEVAPQPEAAPQVYMTYAAPAKDNKKTIEQQPASSALQDTTAQVSGTLSEAVVTRSARKQDKQPSTANTWTIDKGKPFLLSDVEVINITKKAGKKSDTSAIKPEGGWMAFQDYLFSRLSRNDSLALVNGDNNLIPDGLELEFSVDKDGSPYDVKVLHSQDSTLSDKITNAIQSGPKWKGNDNKEERLRLRY